MYVHYLIGLVQNFPKHMNFFKGMTNVTKVVRPIFEKYLARSAVESTILSGALFNVMPRSGRVRIRDHLLYLNHLFELTRQKKSSLILAAFPM